MFARKLPIVAVALLLVLAGCTGGGGGGAAPATDTDAPTDAPSDAGVDSETGGDTSGERGSLDLTEPEVALRDAGSFTATWRFSGVDEDGVEGAVAYTYRADLDGERAHVSWTAEEGGESTTGVFETFTADGTTFTRITSDDSAFYQAQPQEEFDVLAQSLGRTTIYDTDVDGLTRVGTETFDGVRVTRYELSEADAMLWAGLGTTGTEPDDLAEFEVDYTVLVDGDGLARYESWSFTGTTNDGVTTSGSWAYELTDVGTTAVPDPDWLADAKAQTGN